MDQCANCGQVLDATCRVIARQTGIYLCSSTCALQYDNEQKALAAGGQRAALDDQRGWPLARWWNQFYTHRRKALTAFNTELKFKRIQRNARKKVD